MTVNLHQALFGAAMGVLTARVAHPIIYSGEVSAIPYLGAAVCSAAVVAATAPIQKPIEDAIQTVYNKTGNALSTIGSAAEIATCSIVGAGIYLGVLQHITTPFSSVKEELAKVAISAALVYTTKALVIDPAVKKTKENVKWTVDLTSDIAKGALFLGKLAIAHKAAETISQMPDLVEPLVLGTIGAAVIAAPMIFERVFSDQKTPSKKYIN
jgi:hypothetical protein